MAHRARLRELARRAGILDGYRDMRDRQRRTTDETREALLAAMGFNASTEAAAARAIATIEYAHATQMMPAARIVHDAAGHIEFRIPPLAELPRDGVRTTRGPRDERRHGSARHGSRKLEWAIDVWEDGAGNGSGDDGPSIHLSGSAANARAGLQRVALPRSLGTGYHRVRVRLSGDASPDAALRWTRPQGTENTPPTILASDAASVADQLLVVAPRSCVPVEQRIGRDRVFGLVANLWGLRSTADMGAGDTAALRTLVDLTAAAGGAFVGMSPLHALRNHDTHISPYSPISRLFRNPLYLDPAAVPELGESEEARALLESANVVTEISRLHAATRVDYEAVMRVKDAVLDALYATFVARHRDRDTPRAHAFRRYCAGQGEALLDFATFLALDAHFARGRRRRDWQSWPAAFHDARAADVRAFRESHAAEIERHAWVQFELDRQLAAVAAHARERGLRIGLYPDLAIGSAAAGSDAWSFSGLFVDGVSLGAPPDDYSATGQNWALPPIHPLRLTASAYRYWIVLLRNALAHAGALRIDHVMGLFRQFWIPDGRPGDEGAYVRFPAGDLLAILALESHRHDAVIIGEDLGTVPPAVAPALRRQAILSSRVLYYERDRNGRFRASGRYSKRALVTANTHDNAPLAGFWAGRDLELRSRLGTLPPRDHAIAVRQREKDRNALLARLIAEQTLPAGTTDPDATTLCSAVHRYLAHTPSPLLGVALDDVTAEVEPVNVPGVTPDRHPSWTRRQRIPLEQIPADPHACATLAAVRERAAARRSRNPGRR